MEKEDKITGTLVQSYMICPRQAWLMARHVTPDQDNVYLEIGRLVQEQAYERDRKEIYLGHLKIDVLRKGNKSLVVGEVKKSSRAREAARLQLSFYLHELKEMGIEAEGELLFPEEREKELVFLDETTEGRIKKLKQEIAETVYTPRPIPPVRIPYCTHCAYAELCWA